MILNPEMTDSVNINTSFLETQGQSYPVATIKTDGEDYSSITIKEPTLAKSEEAPFGFTSMVLKPEVSDSVNETKETVIAQLATSVSTLVPPSNTGQKRIRHPCEVCKRTCYSKIDQEMHLATHYPFGNDIRCPICSKLILASIYTLHRKKHKNLIHERYKCHVCNRLLGTGKAFKRHKINVHPTQIYTCDKCGMEFKLESLFNAHASNMHRDTPVACSVCSEMLMKDAILKKHKAMHDKKLKRVKCPICSKVLVPDSLKAHKNLHINRVLIACDICGKSYNKGHLKQHMWTHTGERPYACELCEKRFIASPTLKAHKLIHTKERPFVCDVCHKGFRQRTHLQIHIRSHTGENSYVCQICSRRFVSGILLNRYKCPGST